MTIKPQLLFVGPLPEPTTGHSLACKVLLDALMDEYHVDVVDLNKSDFKQGISSLERIAQVLSIAARVARKQRSADVIYFTISESFAGNLKDLLIYAVCARKLPRMVAHLHGGAGMREIMRGRYPLLGALNRLALRRLGGMIVLGERLVDIYSDSIAPDRIHCAANFAEDAVFLDESRIREKFGEADRLHLLFLSNLLPGKGHEELVEAFLGLEPAIRSGLKLDVAGGFDSQARERAFRARISAAPDITYHGIVRGDAKQRLLAQAHVFCLPTYYPYEGQPISILEAYASGAVVITTDHSGIFDVFTNGVNGFAVEKQSIGSLRDALHRVAAERKHLVALALTNAQTANAHYRVPHYINRVRRAMDASVHSATLKCQPPVLEKGEP